MTLHPSSLTRGWSSYLTQICCGLSDSYIFEKFNRTSNSYSPMILQMVFSIPHVGESSTSSRIKVEDNPAIERRGDEEPA